MLRSPTIFGLSPIAFKKIKSLNAVHRLNAVYCGGFRTFFFSREVVTWIPLSISFQTSYVLSGTIN